MEQGDEGQVERALRAVSKAGKGFAAVTPNPRLRLLDQVREVMRLRHYSIRTETVVLRLDTAICQISHDARKGRIDPG